MTDESYPVEEIDFKDKDIDNQYQNSFTLADKSKEEDDRSANYNFACSVDFTRDAVVKITIRGESYPVDEMHSGEKDIHS